MLRNVPDDSRHRSSVPLFGIEERMADGRQAWLFGIEERVADGRHTFFDRRQEMGFSAGRIAEQQN